MENSLLKTRLRDGVKADRFSWLENDARSAKLLVGIAAGCVFVSLVWLAIPLYVIRPFVPQDAHAMVIALEMRKLAPYATAIDACIVAAASLIGWHGSRRFRVVSAILLGIAITEIGAARINIFEKMFHPYTASGFASAKEASIDLGDKVLAVTFAGESHAYPVRLLGYHHVVNDVVGGLPVAVTYCTLCHTGLVWRRELDGRTIRFHLGGINNGNAVLQDDATGTVWQQSTGEAIFGPLKGRRLEIVPSDELTFALWRSEQPDGRVLNADPAYARQYDPKDWEKHIEATHVVVDTARTGIAPHRLMLGLTVAGQSKAYPMDAVLREKSIRDHIAGSPVLILVGPDGVSVRAFELAGVANAAAFVAHEGRVQDTQTGSIWSFQGCAVEGPLKGQCLPELESHLDYWFDWFHHNPATSVFRG